MNQVTSQSRWDLRVLKGGTPSQGWSVGVLVSHEVLQHACLGRKTICRREIPVNGEAEHSSPGWDRDPTAGALLYTSFSDHQAALFQCWP